MTQHFDLFGEPLPESFPETPLLGPHHLEVPSHAPAWFREHLLRLGTLEERDRAIQDFNDQENRRRKAREREQRRWKRAIRCS